MKNIPLRAFHVALITLFLLPFRGQSEIFKYTVKPGDNLSTIVYKHLGSPLYKKNGNLDRAIEFNSLQKNPHLLLPGQIILIDIPANPKDPVVISEFKEEAPAAVVAKEEPSPQPTETSEVLYVEKERPFYLLAALGAVYLSPESKNDSVSSTAQLQLGYSGKRIESSLSYRRGLTHFNDNKSNAEWFQFNLGYSWILSSSPSWTTTFTAVGRIQYYENSVSSPINYFYFSPINSHDLGGRLNFNLANKWDFGALILGSFITETHHIFAETYISHKLSPAWSLGSSYWFDRYNRNSAGFINTEQTHGLEVFGKYHF